MVLSECPLGCDLPTGKASTPLPTAALSVPAGRKMFFVAGREQRMLRTLEEADFGALIVEVE